MAIDELNTGNAGENKETEGGFREGSPDKTRTVSKDSAELAPGGSAQGNPPRTREPLPKTTER